MKRLALCALILSTSLIAACANVQQDDYLALQSVVARNQRKISQLEGQVKQIENRLAASGQPTADLVADVASLRQEVMALRGQAQETEHQLGQLRGEGDGQNVLAAHEARLDKLEKFLAIKTDDGGTPPAAPASGGGDKSEAPAASDQMDDSAKGVYNRGVQLAGQKSYQAARAQYEQVLAKYPKDKVYAPAAQYQIGETFFNQGKYEEAILAYNQVVKRYPQSDKTPAALLKQGLAFKSLGDKRTAKIVLGKLVKDYPKSSQAATAQKELAGL